MLSNFLVKFRDELFNDTVERKKDQFPKEFIYLSVKLFGKQTLNIVIDEETENSLILDTRIVDVCGAVTLRGKIVKQRVWARYKGRSL